MKLIYIGYWGVNEGLTSSTILPHLEILSNFENIESIHYISIERTKKITPIDFGYSNKINHIPIFSSFVNFYWLNKLIELIYVSYKIKRIYNSLNPQYVICKGVPSGNLAYLAGIKMSQLIVESFEPHSDYMRLNKVWGMFDPRYIINKTIENKITKYAYKILTCSYNYAEILKANNITKNNIETMPCAVNIDKFKFNDTIRKLIREQHNIDEKTHVGIYVGKFGGIYYDEEIYYLINNINKQLNSNFFLFVLTPQESRQIKLNFSAFLKPSQLAILSVSFDDVPKYLSASDFAFCFQEKTEISYAFSPIKNGEYWANELPLIIDYNIGDDSDIVQKHKIGLVIDMKNAYVDINFDKLRRDITIKEVASKYRSFKVNEIIYKKILLPK